MSSPTNSLTEASVRSWGEGLSEESELLEFKAADAFGASRRDRKPNGWTQMQERAKDVAAFANSRGGLIVLGVNDVAASSSVSEEGRLQPLDPDRIDAAIEQYRKDVSAYAQPIPLFDLFTVPVANGGSYVVVVVPPSVQAPHRVCPRAERSGWWSPTV
ncbi:ATP-binding protein [Rhodococcus sp. IEGM 1241]|uniref:AlbA family DNA-binding domain-containing protein n=1 Tax=Rhodococcus sp. IEGM 1241 TaxID=3082228 RepID=UPI0029558014|nr:ATP-binding protein [Rhodococcus sp. IEGM 1241]MDV8015547.1 ATP-binding protein [Rhodococcus sp. IEGM 1241]